MRAKTGRWWMVFFLFVSAGVLLGGQPVFAALTISGNPNPDVDQGSDYYFDFKEEVEGEDGPLTFTKTATSQWPNWLKFSATTGILSGKPTNDYENTTVEGIRISVSDGNESARTEPFSITVNPVNDPPEIKDFPSERSVTQDSTWIFKTSNYITDVDNEVFIYNLTTAPTLAQGEAPWWNLADNGDLTLTPKNQHVSTQAYTFTISISDGGVYPPWPPWEDEGISGDPVDEKITMQITVANKNDAPQIIDQGGKELSDPTAISVEQNYVYRDGEGYVNSVENPFIFILNASDPDEETPNGDTLTFNIESIQNSLPDWLEYVPGQPYGSIVNKPDRPDNDDIGIFNIPITVEDTGGLTDSVNLTITVTNKNDDPKISGEPAVTVDQGGEYSFEPFVTDEDVNDSLTYSVTPSPEDLPEWLLFNKETGELYTNPDKKPGNIDVNTQITDIVITATDTGDGSASLEPFTLTVQNKNDPPVITFQEGILADDNGQLVGEVDQGKPFYLEIVEKDIDINIGIEQTLTVAIKNKPEWANWIAPADAEYPRTFIFQSKEPLSNKYAKESPTYGPITVTVSDGQSSTSKEFWVIVNNVNDPPVFSLTTVPAEKKTIREGIDSSYEFQPEATDPDGDILLYSITSESHPYPGQWPNWLKFDPETGRLYTESMLQNEHVGQIKDIVISVTDKKPDGSPVHIPMDPFTLTVNNTNDDPVIINSDLYPNKVGVASESTLQGELFSFTPDIYDPDLEIENPPQPINDVITVFPEVIPSWMTYIENENGTATFVNKRGAPGERYLDDPVSTLKITVFDGQGGNTEMTATITVTEGFSIESGDFDGSGSTDLADVVFALKILAGITPDQYVWIEADTNADEKIDMKDILFVIRELASQ